MNHIIKKQTLAIDIPAGYDAWDIQNNFKEVFNRDVLPRIEKVCDELGVGHQTRFRLDKLTIDAGTIKSRELTSVWANEVENAFRNELIRLKKERHSDNGKKESAETEQSELTVLLHFLENGVMPWWVSEEFNSTPGEILDKQLEDQPAKLVSQILLLKNKKQVSRRLFYQFEAKQLEKLLRHFDKPVLSASLTKFKEICRADLMSVYQGLGRAFLATEIMINIAPKVIGNMPEMLFEVLFDQIKEFDTTSNGVQLSTIHNQLAINNKRTKSSKSVEERSLITTALTVLDRKLIKTSESIQQSTGKAANLQDTKTDSSPVNAITHSLQPETSEKGESRSVTKASSGLESNRSNPQILAGAGNKPGKEADTVLSQGDAHPMTGEGNFHDKRKHDIHTPDESQAQLSSLDKRAWEHIERIKKQQLAELNNARRVDEKSEEGFEKSQSQEITSVIPSDNASKPGMDSNQPSDQSRENESLRNKTVQQEQSRKDSESLEESGLINKEGADTSNVDRNDIDEAESRQGLQEVPVQRSHNISASPGAEVSREPDKNTLEYWQEELETIDECFIQNAGLILFWPYLGHFFKDLGLTADSSFQSANDQHKAALVLQYLLDKMPDLQEHKLPLNKLLCGLKISEPVGKAIELSPEDLNKCNSLLESTIQNWSALRGTSVAGFQNSFVKRNGVLKRHDKHWLLQVEKKPFDMLMEQLPWPIGIVRLSWMKKPIYVEW